jgi:FMN phosphatase YigB (HAD superfamily)
VDRDRSRRAWSERTRLSADTFDPVFFGEKLKHRFNAGEVSEEEFFLAVEGRAEKLLRDGCPPREELRRIFCEMLSPTAQACSVISSLKGRLRLALLSDTDPVHLAHMVSSYPFIADLEPKILSYEIGCTKPSPLIYARAVDLIGLAADRDKLANVEGARALGITSERVESPSRLKDLVAPLLG